MKLESSRRMFLLGATAPLLAGCGPGTLADYTFRLQVRAIIAGIEHVGHSVIRATWDDHRGQSLMNYGAVIRPNNLFGQAVAINLGPAHDHMFALLDGPEGSEYTDQRYFNCFNTPAVVFSGKDVDHAGASELQSLSRRVGESTVSEARWPLFVRFADRSRPATVKEIKPRDFAAVYGAGSYIKDVTIELVRQEPIVDIVQVLPWADEYRRSLVEPADVSGGLAQRLGSNHFIAYRSLSEAARNRASEQSRLFLPGTP